VLLFADKLQFLSWHFQMHPVLYIVFKEFKLAVYRRLSVEKTQLL